MEEPMSKKLIGPHGIDLRAPGGIEALFAFNRSLFGDAVMEAGEGGEGVAEGAAEGAQGEVAGDGDENLGDGGKKALQSEREARKAAEKLASEREARIRELEDAGKSADDKERERVASLEKSDRDKETAIADRDAKLLRYEIAAAKGLDLKAALRLQGSTKEELEADADEFSKSFGSGRVGEVPGAGARGTTEVKTSPGLGTLTHAYETAAK
jgi:hypothetical protein